MTWTLYLNPRWRVQRAEGTLRLRDTTLVPVVVEELEAYRSRARGQLQDQTRQAEEYLSLANRLLEQGSTHLARQAFKSAYGLSAHDAAFNEDARVQLQNLKMQQAVVGLNRRQARMIGQAPGAPPGLAGAGTDFTPQEAREILARQSAEETAIQLKLAERLVQQQEAALTSPAAIRATVPEQGRVLTFARPLAVDPWMDLRLHLKAVAVGTGPGSGARWGILAGLFLVALAWLRLIQRGRREPGTNR